MGSRGSRSRAKKTKGSPRQASDLSGSLARAVTDGALSLEERHQMIAEAAYYLAERRGCAPGDPLQDWLEAEAEVMVRLQDPGARSNKTPSR